MFKAVLRSRSRLYFLPEPLLFLPDPPFFWAELPRNGIFVSQRYHNKSFFINFGPTDQYLISGFIKGSSNNLATIMIPFFAIFMLETYIFLLQLVPDYGNTLRICCRAGAVTATVGNGMRGSPASVLS